MKSPASRHLLLAAATLVAASSAHAAALTWDNAGTLTNNWNTTDFNWGGTTVWTQNDTATFTGTTGESITLTENITATGLTFRNTATSLYAFNIGSGLALNVNGNVTIGANVAGNTTTSATFAGLGSFIVGDGTTDRTFQVGGGAATGNNNSATLDMGGLSTFTANLGTGGTFRIGDVSASSNSTVVPSTVTLAKTSTITAGTLDIGGSTAHAGVNTLKLGGTTNTINANTIYVGVDTTTGRGSGEISFATGTGTLQIRNTAGTGRANMSVGSTTNGTGVIVTGLFDTTGHSADILLGTLGIGNRDLGAVSTSVLSTSGTFSFDAGTLDVTTIKMGARSFNNNAANVTAELNIGGGTVTIGNFSVMGRNNNTSGTGTATATLNISGGTVSIGSIANMAVNGGSDAVVTSTVNITGGTVTLGGDITKSLNPVANVNATATLTLDGGTLDMGGHNIGGAGVQALTNVNLRSGTLKNLAQLNNGGVLTKTTAGTLTLSGTNTYTGGTTISAGTLVAGSNTALGSGSVNVGTAGAILQIGSAGVTLGNGANLAVVDGATIKLGGLVAGALNGVGSVITLDGGTFNFNAAGQLDLGGVLNNLAAGDYTYRLISGAAGVGNTDFLFANITGYDASVTALDYSNGVISFTAVPEPSTYGLIGAGALAAAAFVRRRRKHAGAVAA